MYRERERYRYAVLRLRGLADHPRPDVRAHFFRSARVRAYAMYIYIYIYICRCI